MTWTSLSDFTTGRLVSASDWNKMMGASGNLAESAAAKVTTAGDLTYATGDKALARLAAVAVGQVLTSQGVGVAPAWAAPASGSSSSETLLTGADVAMASANTWYTGVSVSLAAGTWLLFAQAALTCSTSNVNYFIRLLQVTGTVTLSEATINNGSNSGIRSLVCVGQVVLAGTETIRLEASMSAVSSSSIVRNTGNPAGTLTGTKILALKIA